MKGVEKMKTTNNRVYRVYLEKPSEIVGGESQCYICRVVAKSVVDLKKQCSELDADVVKYQDITHEYRKLTDDEIRTACIEYFNLDEIETDLNFEK